VNIVVVKSGLKTGLTSQVHCFSSTNCWRIQTQEMGQIFHRPTIKKSSASECSDERLGTKHIDTVRTWTMETSTRIRRHKVHGSECTVQT
jgi:hypothetical protein